MKNTKNITDKSYNYISIKYVIESVYSLLPEEDFDEETFIEWAIQGYRKLNLPAKYEEAVCLLKIDHHKAELPSDLWSINQIFYLEGFVQNLDFQNKIRDFLGYDIYDPIYGYITKSVDFLSDFLWNNYRNHVIPMRKYSGYFGPVDFYDTLPRQNCEHVYSINHNFITSSLKEGCVMISYKKRVTDCDGLDIIPDNENLKDALVSFCLFRYWMYRTNTKEQNAMQLMEYYNRRYSLLSKKSVAEINMPDLNTIENIKNYTQRLIPQSHLYETAFSRFNNKENTSF